MLQITTPAESHNLTTLDAVKDVLEIADRSEDERLSRWIAQASAAIYEHCNRTFISETVAETFRLSARSDEVLLSRYPVADVASITECEVAIEAGDYEVDTVNGIVRRLRSNKLSCWPAGTIVVTYTAGYESADLPEDIEGAAIALVKQYRFGAQRDPQVRGEEIDGAGSFSYFDGLAHSGMSPEIVGLLSKHVKPIVG
jgi:hypothetical protein